MNKLQLSHPDKILFPGSAITKLDVARYYATVNPLILTHLKNRPITLIRCTQNIEKPCFYQKHWNSSMPEAIHYHCIREKNNESPYIMVNSPQALLRCIQLDNIEFHPWGASINDIEKPDRLIFDLDPSPEIKWKTVISAAEEIATQLAKIGLPSFVKLTGGKGLHLVSPIMRTLNWHDLKLFSQSFAKYMQNLNPKLYTANMNKRERSNKIFIDYLRNSRGATAVAAYSLRIKPNAPVAMPIHWNDLRKTNSSDEFNVFTALDKLSDDPWPDFFKTKTRITSSMQQTILE